MTLPLVKFLSISCLFFSCNNYTFACSELGGDEFKITKKARENCGRKASIVATAAVNAMVNIEKNEKKFVPTKEVKFKHTILYKAEYVGQSKMLGFNVTLQSEDGWECTVCVDMFFDNKQHCYAKSIDLHMCAK